MPRHRSDQITGTDPSAIADHLNRFLSDLRKHRLAKDLIGDDERSAEFGVEDFDAFANELSAGVDLTSIDLHKIKRRAMRLAEMRKARS